MKGALLLLSGLLVAPAILAQTNLFPFVLPWDDVTPSVANVSTWLDRPAGVHGVVTTRDGHFFTGNQRIRFFGVNFVGPGAFPRREDADKIAGRLAKFGINVVRFHHMDSDWSPLIAYAQGTSRQLNPETLDRLDYLIAQLKAHGIYANLNLLVGRQFKAADGLPAEIERLDAKEQHVVGFFFAPVLELQKEYARLLLTHRNAYTGKTYVEDPAVAFVEINNENGLIHAWLSGEVDKLPAVFLRDLQRQWNDWLRARYGSTAKLRQAWNVKTEPLGNEQIIADCWVLEQHEGAKASVVDQCITVTKTGSAGWHVQFNQPGIKLTSNRAYTVRFRAKADRPVTVNVNVGEAHAAWQGLGLSAPVALTTEWREFQFTFNAARTDDNARLCFSDLAKQTGQHWFADVSLRPGGVIGLADNERLEDANLPVFQHNNVGARTAEAQHDWMRFLWETEDRYWQTMYRYVKDELKFRSVVMGTIVGCSTPNLMAKLDAVDTHAYWQHPQFPGRPWDAGNWFVPNKTMVNERGGTLPGLALRRVLGKPHCVTEYNHPAPNTYSSEGFLLLAACAAMQDWDAIYAYDYCSRKDEWDARRIPNFFDIDQHPTKMVTLPAAVALFVRGDIQPARELVVAALDKEREIALLPRCHAWELGAADLPPEVTLCDRVAIATGQSSCTQPRHPSPAEFVWRTGLVTVNTPRSKAVIGFAGGQRIELGNMIIEPGPTMQAGWCAITTTEMQPGRWLITATGYVENPGMGWKNDEKSTVGRDWGRAPSLIEGIPVKIMLPRASRAWALDERGQRGAELPVRNGVINLGPQHRTLWYEVETH
jgi:hypothetical protein